MNGPDSRPRPRCSRHRGSRGVVHADPRGGAEADEKPEGEVEGAGRKVERDPRIEVTRPRQHHDDDRENRPRPQRHGDRRDRFDAPVQQRDVHEPDGRHDEHRLPRGDSFPDVAEVLREAVVARRDLERPVQHELPHEQKTHQPAERRWTVALAQIAERSARPRHRRAQLAPYHPVAQHDDERDRPAEHRLRAAERRHEERDRDERSDPDHVRHVERRGVQQAKATRHARRRHVSSAQWRCRRSSRWRFTSDHSVRRMLYITVSRTVPSRRAA